MGVNDRRPPPLPAPTETSSDNLGGTTTSVDDLATDVSRRTDFTSQTIPEDGSPIVISTSKKGHRATDLAKHNQSQTSLLIEYFEAGKTGDKQRSRPSVRVRVTPSRSKGKEGSDHIQITETGKARKPSYTRRISLGSKREENVPLVPGASELSYSTGSNVTGPVEVEVLPSASDLSRSDIGTSYPYPSLVQGSEISSMPADSTLDGDLRIHTPPRARSPLIEEAVHDHSIHDHSVHDHSSPATLRAPERNRSLSREREITHRVMEKIAQREASGKHSPSSRRVSSREYVPASPSSARAPSERSRTLDSSHDQISSLNPSDISRKTDRSVRSGTSNVSINNPKLLQTVEDAIKRLILPELNAVKEEQRLQRNMSQYESKTRSDRTSSRTEEGLERRMSKSSSLPDVKGVRPKIMVTNESDELSPGKLRGERRSSRGSDRSDRSRQTSAETVARSGERVRTRKSKDKSMLKDAALVAGAGALTAAALKHHESTSSIGSGDHERRRRKRRSKSRSRTASMSEDVEHTADHGLSIPPMPMMPSEIGTDMTRDSIRSADESDMLHSRDSRDMTPPPKQFEVRQVTRGSPREVREVVSDGSPTTPTRTPTRTPAGLQKGLGAFHSNASGTNIDMPIQTRERGYRDSLAPAAGAAAAALGGPAVMSSLQDISGLHESMSANTLDHYTPQRPLSPIQSVSSYRDSTIEPVQHSRVQSIRSEASLRSPENRRSRAVSARSADSYDSAQSAEFTYAKNRPAGFSLERGYEILPEDEYEPETPTSAFAGEGETPRAAEVDDWFERGHETNERYRHEDDPEFTDDSQRDSGAEYNRLSTFTNSSGGPALDKVTAGQGLRRVDDNAEYVSTPVAVESAVASLHEPSSLLSSHSAHSTQNSPVKDETPRSNGSFAEREAARQQQQAEVLGLGDNSSRERWGAIRDKARSLSGQSPQRDQYVGSPTQSPALSAASQPIKLSSSALPVAGQDLPAVGHGLDEEEMETNPSIIRGPMGGYPHGDQSHWPYDPTPPMTGKNLMRPESQADEVEDHGHDAELGAAVGAGLGGVAAGLGLANLQGTGKQIDRGQRDIDYKQLPPAEEQYEIDPEQGYDAGQGTFAAPHLHASSPAYLKDEGYMSSAQRDYTPEPYAERELDDPVRSNRAMKHLSGMSHGMESPLYDSATGKGVDRIQSKDVVALMDHLTVRDAQRNARDTEILVTLVRSAAEMRNSFEEMKQFIEAQDRLIMQNTDRNADGVVNKVLGGPRPQPSASPKAVRRAPSSDDGDTVAAARKQNFVKRALKGLSMRSTNDLGNIESMLMQLLNEVEGLKEAQARQTTAPPSVASNEYLRQQPDPGYEPEGQAGTSSNPSQSGFLSNSSSRQLNGMQPMHSGFDGRRASGNRISTVDERDEDEYNNDAQYGMDEDRMTTPTQEVRRDNSLPLESPRQQQNVTFRDANEAEETPKTKSSKYRSQGSSVFGNFANKVSRWSKTTTGTDVSNRASTERAQRPYSEASRSGSNLDVTQLGGNYALNEDDRLRSANSLAREQQYDEEGTATDGQARAASPLIPDGASFERPTYEAHRNSLNLQHPQPRQGPTGRHQDNLESRAQTYYDSLLPEEMDATWGSNPSLSLNRNMNRLSASTGGNLSPVYSENASVHSASEQTMQAQHPPPRPPKIRDDGPLVPAQSQSQTQQPTSLNSSGGSSNQYYATPLEPIAEARYSLETDRTRHLTPSPNPQAQPQTMQSSQRRITPAGPRAMGSSRSPSGASAGAAGPSAHEGGSPDGVIRRKPVSVKSTASSSLISYRSSLDDDEMF